MIKKTTQSTRWSETVVYIFGVGIATAAGLNSVRESSWARRAHIPRNPTAGQTAQQQNDWAY